MSSLLPLAWLGRPRTGWRKRFRSLHSVRKKSSHSETLARMESCMKVLVIDVGGTHVKLLVSSEREPRKFASGPTLTAKQLITRVKKVVGDWRYDAISIGFPGPVLRNHPVAEPRHLGGGWVGCDFRSGFDRRVKLVNDAAMQALGSYRKGKMLFLGFGTGLGSAMIVDGIV